MNLLDLARSALPNASGVAGSVATPDANSENTLPHPPGKTAISPFGSKGSPLGGRISANDERVADVDPTTDARRQKVVAMLTAHPGWRYAVITDTEAESDTVCVHIGIRGIGLGEIVIAKARYDGIELMRALEDRQAEDQDGTERT